MAREKKTALIPPVQSLAELRTRAAQDPRYDQLLRIAARNLSGMRCDADAAYRWLCLTAAETSERGVVDEVNYCRDLVD